MSDVGTFKLGRLPKVTDPRTIQLRALVEQPATSLPPIPARVLNIAKAKQAFPMYANDRYGDCGFAAEGHAIHCWTAAAGREQVPVLDDVIAGYERVTGFDPADPSTDRGVMLLDAVKDWRSNGFGNSGDRIDAFVAVDVRNAMHVKLAIKLFGGLYAGVALPITAQRQTSAGRWRVVRTDGDGQPGSWGGHCTFIGDYNANGLACITWGKRVGLSWGFLGTYYDEAYALVSRDQLDAAGLSGGLTWAALRQALGYVA